MNRRQRQRAKARQARRTEFEGIAHAKRQAYARQDRDVLADLLGRHIVANLGKFHAKNRPVAVIRDESGKGYAFSAVRRSVAAKQSKLNSQFFPTIGVVRLAGITQDMFNLLRLSEYGFRFTAKVWNGEQSVKIGCYAKLEEIDRQRMAFNANLAQLLPLLP
jgi:hypothetical protein